MKKKSILLTIALLTSLSTLVSCNNRTSSSNNPTGSSDISDSSQSSYEDNTLALNQSAKVLYVGETYQIETISHIEGLTYESDTTKVATVNENGLVTANYRGNATITVKSSDEQKVTCFITVYNSPLENVFYKLQGNVTLKGSVTQTYASNSLTGSIETTFNEEMYQTHITDGYVYLSQDVMIRRNSENYAEEIYINADNELEADLMYGEYDTYTPISWTEYENPFNSFKTDYLNPSTTNGLRYSLDTTDEAKAAGKALLKLVAGYEYPSLTSMSVTLKDGEVTGLRFTVSGLYIGSYAFSTTYNFTTINYTNPIILEEPTPYTNNNDANLKSSLKNIRTGEKLYGFYTDVKMKNNLTFSTFTAADSNMVYLYSYGYGDNVTSEDNRANATYNKATPWAGHPNEETLGNAFYIGGLRNFYNSSNERTGISNLIQLPSIADSTTNKPYFGYANEIEASDSIDEIETQKDRKVQIQDFSVYPQVIYPSELFTAGTTDNTFYVSEDYAPNLFLGLNYTIGNSLYPGGYYSTANQIVDATITMDGSNISTITFNGISSLSQYSTSADYNLLSVTLTFVYEDDTPIPFTVEQLNKNNYPGIAQYDGVYSFDLDDNTTRNIIIERGEILVKDVNKTTNEDTLHALTSGRILDNGNISFSVEGTAYELAVDKTNNVYTLIEAISRDTNALTFSSVSLNYNK